MNVRSDRERVVVWTVCQSVRCVETRETLDLIIESELQTTWSHESQPVVLTPSTLFAVLFSLCLSLSFRSYLYVNICDNSSFFYIYIYIYIYNICSVYTLICLITPCQIPFFFSFFFTDKACKKPIFFHILKIFNVFLNIYICILFIYLWS